jgi:hypothetical protein
MKTLSNAKTKNGIIFKLNKNIGGGSVTGWNSRNCWQRNFLKLSSLGFFSTYVWKN